MAATTKTRARQLQSLLDAVERGNKRDAHDYTSGHLNESNLRPPPEFSRHKGWPTAKTENIPAKKSSKLPVSMKAKKDKEKNMSDVLTQFSGGVEGFLPHVKKPKPKPKEPGWPSELTGSVDEQALIEELDSRRLMLNRSQPTRLQRSWALMDDDSDWRSEQSRSVPLRHGFYSLNSGATKRDQYQDFKRFESSKLRKQDLLEKNVLTGDHNAIKIEEKLNRKLMILGHGPGTAFHRLQAHSEGLQDLIELSPLFSDLLEQIRQEYDEYVGWLLDTHPTQSHILRQQVDDLYDKRISNPKQLEQVKRETSRLEEQGRLLLEKNDSLREELRVASKASNKLPTDFYSQKRTFNRDDKSHFDLADQLEDLHATILEKLDVLNGMRKKMRQELVPTNVCQNLEQCLKDSEIEVQKLLKQNEVLSKSIEEMEDEISKAISDCDVSDRDKKRCSEKVNRTYLPGIKRPFTDYEEYSDFIDKYANDLPTNLSHPFQEGDDSEEDDDTQQDKWAWYIS